jgi:uncharacterized protein YbjT (DUF2867 family)
MDGDFQANVNLIEEAKRSGVKKFIYVSVLNGEKFKQTKICYAKEALVDYLKQSGMAYTIVRPNGFFSDMVAPQYGQHLLKNSFEVSALPKMLSNTGEQ